MRKITKRKMAQQLANHNRKEKIKNMLVNDCKMNRQLSEYEHLHRLLTLSQESVHW